MPHPPPASASDHADEPDLLDAAEAAEVIEDNNEDGMDVDSGSDSDDPDMPLEAELHNDSLAYFDAHTSSIFTIAAHPTDPSIHLTGGGDDTAYIWSLSPAASPDATITPHECALVAKLGTHGDSVVATAFTKDGNFAVTAGLDGAVHVYAAARNWAQTARVQEVDEIVWMYAHPSEPLIAVGGSDGSVWLYDLDTQGGLTIRHVGYKHTASCTAGTFSRSGHLLATVSEDGSLYAWDVATGAALVALTASDARFAIEGGLFSVAISPSGAVAAVGGATGELRIVGLPGAATTGLRTGARPQASGGGSSGGDQAGKVLATLHTHSESVESLSFHPSIPLLASGSVDGKIGLYDAAKGYSVRRMLQGHEDAVVKIEFADVPGEWILTSCGIDGTVRRWDARAGEQLASLKGHLGGNGAEGEGGVLGFVQTKDRVVTAGDDGVALVFDVSAFTGGAVAGTGFGVRS
ncbi:WD40-repeat-containing domain protein [Geopyxis carbonaria]|nr:WD40-repeat-containing domain protein [Geopyxis carbonaria]